MVTVGFTFNLHQIWTLHANLRMLSIDAIYMSHTKVLSITQCNLLYFLNMINWPAPPTIHRGLEWPQCLNSLIVYLIVCLFVGKFSPFHSFNFISFISNSKIFAVNSFHSFQFLKYSLWIPRMIPDLQVGLLWPAQWQFLRITLHLRTGSGVISAYNFTKLWNVRNWSARPGSDWCIPAGDSSPWLWYAAMC